MIDFFEIDENKKSVKTIELDDFSVEDLEKYIDELSNEIQRVNLELQKMNNKKKEAEYFFK